MKFAHKLTLALLVVLTVVLSLCNTVLIGQQFRQELHTWTPETSQSQTEEVLQLGKPVEDDRPSAQPEILGKPMDDDKPKQQASLAKALNDLLFGAGGPAAEKYKNSPLADQTK